MSSAPMQCRSGGAPCVVVPRRPQPETEMEGRTMEPVAHLKNPTIPRDVVALATKTEEALSRLPQVPNEIAEFLHDHGIKGTQCFSTNCPIANWLKQEVPELAETTAVAVTPLIAEVAQLVEVEMPPVVTDFIVAFDAGDYEFLFDDEPCRVGQHVVSTTTLGEFA